MVDLKLKFPENFFEEEVRSGFQVTKKRKEVWAVELDLLAELLRVCKKHNIQIVGCGGTVLGAVRHKGFIPWDDDIDMMMLRSEYEKLCAVAPEEFEEPYFFQTRYTDPFAMHPHIQIRNSETTGILMCEINRDFEYNQGIFIDVFPLDNVVDDDGLLLKQINTINKYKNLEQKLFYQKYQYDNKINSRKSRLKHRLLLPFLWLYQPDKFFKIIEAAEGKYNGINTEYATQACFHLNKKYLYRKKDYFNKIIYVPFEMLNIPICSEYTAMLDTRYGNWHEYVQGGSAHGNVFFDTDRPYKEYLREKGQIHFKEF